MDLLAFLPLLLLPIAFAISIYGQVVGRRRVKQALRETFLRLRFDTPDGVVGGDAIRVVKIFKQGEKTGVRVEFPGTTRVRVEFPKPR